MKKITSPDKVQYCNVYLVLDIFTIVLRQIDMKVWGTDWTHHLTRMIIIIIIYFLSTRSTDNNMFLQFTWLTAIAVPLLCFWDICVRSKEGWSWDLISLFIVMVNQPLSSKQLITIMIIQAYQCAVTLISV